MKLIGFLRVKNNAATINECLAGLSPLVDEIIILDNGSTDDTQARCRSFLKVVQVIYLPEEYNEGRDKKLLLVEARKRNPDWMIFIDADEVFEKHFTREVIEQYMRSKYDRIEFRMCNFWLSRTHCRYDRNWFRYNLIPQRSMWRNLDKAYFHDIKAYSGNIQGLDDNVYLSPYRIKHYGYIDKKYVAEKYALYEKMAVRTHGHLNINAKGIKLYKFVEFGNATLNYIYITLYSWLCSLLFLVFRAKRKYLKGYRLFPV